MRLEPPLVGVGEHLVGHPRGVADAQHRNTSVGKLLAYPVHRHIALCAHHHLAFALERLVYRLHQGGGLARARRSVDHSHVLRPQHVVHGEVLCGVEPGEADGVERERLRPLASGIEQVAQVCHAVALGADGSVEGLKHQSVARLVEEHLHSYTFAVLQRRGDAGLLGHRHHHASAVCIAHDARGDDVERGLCAPVCCLRLVCRQGEEAYGSAVFEVVLYVLVGCAEHLHGKLVQRVVVTPAYAHGMPSVAPLDAPLQSCSLHLSAVVLLLLLVFRLEQSLLP